MVSHSFCPLNERYDERDKKKKSQLDSKKELGVERKMTQCRERERNGFNVGVIVEV